MKRIKLLVILLASIMFFGAVIKHGPSLLDNYQIIGSPVDNFQLKIDITGSDTTWNYEADAGAGSGDEAKADTAGDGTNVVDLSSPFIIQQGDNIELIVINGDTVNISSTGGGLWVARNDSIFLVDSDGDTTAIIYDDDLGNVGWRVAIEDQTLKIIVDSLSVEGTGSGIIELFGVTSGSASLTVPAIAGTPANIQLPSVTGSANNFWMTNGATPQVTSWQPIDSNFIANGDLSTNDIEGGNWQVYYSNGSGVIQQLPLGTSGQHLESNGTTSAPSWETPTGGSSIWAIGGVSSGIDSVAVLVDADNDTSMIITDNDAGGVTWVIGADQSTLNVLMTTLTLNGDPLTDITGTEITTSAGQLVYVINSVDDTHIDFGTGANQVEITDIPGENFNLYYTNGSGVLTALAMVADGQYLASQGTAQPPVWQVIAFADLPDFVGGDVTGTGAVLTIGANKVEATMADHTTLTLGTDALSADEAYFGTNVGATFGGIIFEGSTDDGVQGLLTVVDPTVIDKTWFLQDQDGTLYQTTGTDVAVTDGGTGLSTLTQDALILGAGVADVTFVAMTSAQILVANGSNIPTAVAMSGDVNIDNAGSTTIQANAVDDTKIDFGTGANQVSIIDIPAVADRALYSNSSGVITEFVFGVNNTFMKSTGTTGDPVFSAIDSNVVADGDLSIADISRNFQYIDPAGEVGGATSIGPGDSVLLEFSSFDGTTYRLFVDSSIDESGDLQTDTISIPFRMPQWASQLDTIVIIYQSKSATADTAEISLVEVWGPTKLSSAIVEDSSYFSDGTDQANTSITAYKLNVNNTQLDGGDYFTVMIETTLGANVNGVVKVYRVYAVVSD